MTIRWMTAAVACAVVALVVRVGWGQATGTQPETARTPLATTLSDGGRAGLESHLDDWAQLARYAKENAALASPAAGVQRVVFYGDSITDHWGRGAQGGSFFPGKPYVNRGISGQTTAQMVVRFQQDVVALKPAAVVILAGTNDIAGNTGPTTLDAIEDNFRSMAQIAEANGIRVVLASVLPVSHYPWRPDVAPAKTIVDLNAWIKAYSEQIHGVYLDYYAAVNDGQGGMKPELTTDKFVHPNAAGYAVMAPLAEAAVAKSLAKPAPKCSW